MGLGKLWSPFFSGRLQPPQPLSGALKKLPVIFWNYCRFIWTYKKQYRDIMYSILSFPPIGTFCKTVVKYHRQAIDIDAIHQFYLDFPVILVLICVCVVLCNFYNTCEFVQPPPQLRYWTIPSLHVSLFQYINFALTPCLTFTGTEFWQSSICSPFLKFCYFKNAT